MNSWRVLHSKGWISPVSGVSVAPALFKRVAGGLEAARLARLALQAGGGSERPFGQNQDNFFEMSFFTQFRLCEALRDFSMQQMEKWSEEYKAEQRSDESENWKLHQVPAVTFSAQYHRWGQSSLLSQSISQSCGSPSTKSNSPSSLTSSAVSLALLRPLCLDPRPHQQASPRWLQVAGWQSTHHSLNLFWPSENKLPKLRRHASRVSFGSKKFGPN